MKELLVFDLDGTLINREQVLSPYTRQVLHALRQRDIHFTIATGRSRPVAEPCYQGFHFHLPQVYKNGAIVWNPDSQRYSHRMHLTGSDVETILSMAVSYPVNLFMFAMDDNHHPCFWFKEHPQLKSQPNKLHEILGKLQSNHSHLQWSDDKLLASEHSVINVLSIGRERAILDLAKDLESTGRWQVHYSDDMYYSGFYWLDVHHKEVSKGQAVAKLKQDFAYDYVIAFGDAHNDHDLFGIADEAYAPANADAYIQQCATAVIGHHDEDGIANFLAERFNLPC